MTQARWSLSLLTSGAVQSNRVSYIST